MSEADLLCAMQTKAKYKKKKKRVPSCSLHQLEFMQTFLNLTATTKNQRKIQYFCKIEYQLFYLDSQSWL